VEGNQTLERVREIGLIAVVRGESREAVCVGRDVNGREVHGRVPSMGRAGPAHDWPYWGAGAASGPRQAMWR